MKSVYVLCDPRDGSIRYVGQTKDMRVRYTRHIANKSASPVSDWIRDLIHEGKRPEMMRIARVRDKLASRYEERMIRAFLREGEPLLNVQHAPGRASIGAIGTVVRRSSQSR